MDDTSMELLSLLTEDYYGLWEIAVQVPGARDEVARAIDHLVDSGLAEWFARAEDSAAAVPLGETGQSAPDLRSGESWETPASPRSPQVLLGVTEAGRRAYFGSEG